MDKEKEKLEIAFKDVRKAYRLLYSYQQRVMELVQFIGNHYGFSYDRAWALFSDREKGNPSPKDLKLNDWAWEMLGMYSIGFLFKPKEGEDIIFMVTLVSDTGGYDVSKPTYEAENFKAIDESATQLHLQLKSITANGADYHDKMFKKIGKKEYVSKEPNDFFIGKKYDLSDFMNEESTLDKLKDFENFCSDNGIVLRPNK